MEGRLGILIVEDDLIQSIMLVKLLESLNHSVLGTTMYGEDAIDMVVELSPDIIFIDIALAGTLNGIELAQKINKISSAAIIYVTGNSRITENKKLKSSRFHDVLIKPYLKSDLMTTISKFIEER